MSKAGKYIVTRGVLHLGGSVIHEGAELYLSHEDATIGLLAGVIAPVGAGAPDEWSQLDGGPLSLAEFSALSRKKFDAELPREHMRYVEAHGRKHVEQEETAPPKPPVVPPPGAVTKPSDDGKPDAS